MKLSGDEKIPLSPAEFESLLINNLKIQKGDTVIVHSSFGNMNAGFSPQEAVRILKKVVGKEGNLLMPFYPTGHAYYWIQEDNVFDVHHSKSCMGILTQVFKESEGTKVSPHPVKAMTVWGKDQEFLISDHHQSLYPYDVHSPYYKTSLLPNSKTIGLGVEINSFLHTCEDLFLQDKSEIYSDRLFKGKVNYYDSIIEVETYLHEPQKVNSILTPCEFLKKINCPGYEVHNYKGTVYFCSSNKEALKYTEHLFRKGQSRTIASKSN